MKYPRRNIFTVRLDDITAQCIDDLRVPRSEFLYIAARIALAELCGTPTDDLRDRLREITIRQTQQ